MKDYAELIGSLKSKSENETFSRYLSILFHQYLEGYDESPLTDYLENGFYIYENSMKNSRHATFSFVIILDSSGDFLISCLDNQVKANIKRCNGEDIEKLFECFFDKSSKDNEYEKELCFRSIFGFNMPFKVDSVPEITFYPMPENFSLFFQNILNLSINTQDIFV